MSSDSVPVAKWTDDEWLWALTTFPPNTNVQEIEREIAERRIQRIMRDHNVSRPTAEYVAEAIQMVIDAKAARKQKGH
jgi:hypothetical protein